MIEKTGLLMVWLTNIMFTTEIFLYPVNVVSWFFLIVVLILLSSSYLDRKKQKHTRYSVLLIVGGLGLMSCTLYPFYIGLLYILTGILEKYFISKKEIGFSNLEIAENGIFNKKTRWDELSNVIIKDGLLTLDFKNNKLIQLETDDEDDDEYEVDDMEFNEYCRKRLSDSYKL